nr:hypothetical protein [uncultured Desulfobulbus sp.]
MEFSERDRNLGNIGYESMVWVRDDKGREFSCNLDDGRGGVKSFNDLTDHEKASCTNVNEIIGTERW